MKTTAVIAFLTVLATVAIAVPALKATRWDVIQNKVDAIRRAVVGGAALGRNIAIRDNPTVGINIAAKLDAAAAQASLVLDGANSAIAGQTLTVAQSQLIFGVLRDIVVQAQGDVQGEVDQLSPGAATEIREGFITVLGMVDATARQVAAELVRPGPGVYSVGVKM